MSVRTLILGWLGLAALLSAFMVLGILLAAADERLKKRTRPPDPERTALDELERLYRLPAYRQRRVP